MSRKPLTIERGWAPGNASHDQVMKTPEQLDLAFPLIEDQDSSENDDRRQAPRSEQPTTADSVSLYLRQIGKVPLLSAAEEVALAKRIVAGKRAAEELKQPALEATHRTELQRLIVAGQHARQQMVEANLRLVISMARRYQGQGIPFSDLIQEGNLGLLAATEKYDYQKGFRFSTYAVWWIRQYLSRAIANQARLVRLPVYVIDGLRRVGQVRQELEQTLTREPSTEEVAQAVGMSVERLREMVSASQPLISLDTPLTEDGELGLGDFLVDERERTPLEVVVDAVPHLILTEALAGLREREREVLELRYGLRDGQERTLQTVGMMVGLTRERVRQIEQEALRKLRQSAAVRALGDHESPPIGDSKETRYAS